jgi:cobalt-zinc-cadmium efflux system outer membrane protein
VGAGLPGCLTPASYEHSAPPAELSVVPNRPVTRAQSDSDVTPVTWVRPGEVPTPTALPTVVQDPPKDPKAAPLPPPKKVELPHTFEVPNGLPGAGQPSIVLPPITPDNRAERMRLIDQMFPEHPPLAPDPLVDGQPGAKIATLEELLEIAKKNSPELQQAAADIADAQGRWVQAGLYPNPTVGFQGDQMLDMGYPGQLGGYFNQSIVTGGKLNLARAVAYFDLVNARVRLRRNEVELANRVRSAYTQTLVAAENVRMGRIVVAFTDEVYRRQVNLVKGGAAGPYEASAMEAIAAQAEVALAASRNRYSFSWKQLAAAVGVPELPLAPIAGAPQTDLPRFHYETLRRQMLAIHTDLVEARNSIARAERTIAREQAQRIPDLQNQFYFEQDTQAKAEGLPSFQMGAQVGVTVPLFNRNQGAIMSARAQLARATAEVPRITNQLSRQLADAFERYETARQQAELYRTRILPNLALAFRGVYQRYQLEPDKVNYNDIATAQQNYVNQLAAYMQVLLQQGQALVDLAGAVQVPDPAELQRPDKLDGDTWPDVIRRQAPKK